jgi:hypothetical protein
MEPMIECGANGITEIGNWYGWSEGMVVRADLARFFRSCILGRAF